MRGLENDENCTISPPFLSPSLSNAPSTKSNSFEFGTHLCKYHIWVLILSCSNAMFANGLLSELSQKEMSFRKNERMQL